MNGRQSYKSLRRKAVLWWPEDLVRRERDSSIIPQLIGTQDKFISLLHVSDKSPVGWKTVLQNTGDLPPNLFLKHLIVLTDFGGEPLKRVKPVLCTSLTDGKLHFVWKGEEEEYAFKSLGEKGLWTNSRLLVDGKGLVQERELTGPMEDVTMLLLHGAAAVNTGMPETVLERCIIGGMIGNKAELDRFVRQRYIWVSRITGGASANRLGHLAEEYVREGLCNMLPSWDFSRKTIPGVSQNEGRTDMTFDIVAGSPDGKYCAIEVSFQVTTNSTIERKQGQARARQMNLHGFGHHIAYVIDGAGNFERRAALSTICEFSDCTVTFRGEELERLARFLEAI